MEGAIFDLDGTLLDSMAVWETYGTTYLKLRGYNAPDELNEKFRAFSLLEASEFCKELLNSPLSVEEIAKDINSVAEEAYFNTLQLKPGVKEFLEKLYNKGVKLCVATATDRYMTKAALERNGVLNLFEFIITCTEAGAGKNYPDIFNKALEQLGTKKEETYIFEDAIHAIKTAKNAGFKVCAVYDKFEKHPQEVMNLADIYIASWPNATV